MDGTRVRVDSFRGPGVEETGRVSSWVSSEKVLTKIDWSQVSVSY